MADKLVNIALEQVVQNNKDLFKDSKEEKIDGIFRGKFPEWGAGASFIGTGKGAPSNILNVDIKVSL